MEKVFSKMRKSSCFTKIFTKFGWQNIRIYATICDENEENNLSQQIVESGVNSRKISIFKEFLRHDKNIICLPRQYTNRARKPLIFLDFLKLTEKIYYLFTTYQNYWLPCHDINKIEHYSHERRYLIPTGKHGTPLFFCPHVTQ